MRIAEMSSLFTDMLDSLNEQSECVEMDFADEASFTLVLQFCKLVNYTSRDKIPRSLLKMPEARTLE